MNLFLTASIFVGIVIGIALVYALGGLLFATLWNWLIPTLWASAPHLSWMQGIAVAWILAILQSIFGRKIVVKKG